MNEILSDIVEPLEKVRYAIDCSISEHGIAILPPGDVNQTLRFLTHLGYKASTVMLDPWYNKGVGGVRDDYIEYIVQMLENAQPLGQHIYLWGFPEIVAHFVERLPEPLELVTWLTWYYKNNPSVIRGWRSAQNACLHISNPGAKLYPEHFLNEKQLALKEAGKLRYMPGPASVIEASLLVGFIGKKEQTGHPSQKPVAVYEPLLKMTCTDEDLVIDPMCGSGTTGVVARKLNVNSILRDESEEYTKLVEKRLGVRRLRIATDIKKVMRKAEQVN